MSSSVEPNKINSNSSNCSSNSSSSNENEGCCVNNGCLCGVDKNGCCNISFKTTSSPPLPSPPLTSVAAAVAATIKVDLNAQDAALPGCNNSSNQNNNNKPSSPKNISCYFANNYEQIKHYPVPVPPLPTIPSLNDTESLNDVILNLDCKEDIDQLHTEVTPIWPKFYQLLMCSRNNIFQSVVELLTWKLGGDRRYIVSQLNENQTTLIPLYDSKVTPTSVSTPTTPPTPPAAPSSLSATLDQISSPPLKSINSPPICISTSTTTTTTTSTVTTNSTPTLLSSSTTSSNSTTPPATSSPTLNSSTNSGCSSNSFSPIFLEPIPSIDSPSTQVAWNDVLHQIKDDQSVIYNEKESILHIPLYYRFILGEITIKPFYKHELELLTTSQLIRFIRKKSIKEMERIKSESLLNFFVEYSCTDSNDLFHSLTKYLCYYLGVKHAFVCQFIPPDTSITISYCKDGVIQPNIEYSLSGTPCGELCEKKPVHYANNIVTLFPEDKWLAENDIVSYLGIPFLDSVGDMLGHLTVMNDREIKPDILYTSILAALANKTTMELERRKVAENFAVTKELLNQFPSTSVILTNAEGKISRTFGCQLFDFQSTELIDQSIDQLQFQNQQEMMLSQMIPVITMTDGTTVSNPEGIKMEVVCSKKSQETFPAEVYVKNINIHKDKFIGRMYVIRDITETKNNQRTLVEARDRALQAVQMKSQFMASISHEIRTPMNAVIGLSEILLSSNLPQVHLNVVETLHKSADLLYSITSDILDFQRIEASKLELEIIEFDFQGCIEGIVNTLSLQLDKPIEILLSFDNKIPKILKGDPNRIRQVLLNLGQNSIKYTNYGHIYIKISLLHHIGDKCKISFSIEDTGIGMEESQHSRLFQPFHQLDSSTTRKYGGSGLGLSICKKMVELMCGEIRLVKSAPMCGSTFEFTVELEEPQFDIPQQKPIGMIGFLDSDGNKSATLQIQENNIVQPIQSISNSISNVKSFTILIVDDYDFGKKILVRKLYQEMPTCTIKTLTTPEMVEYMEAPKLAAPGNKSYDLYILVERDSSSPAFLSSPANQDIQVDLYQLATKLAKLQRLSKIILASNVSVEHKQRAEFFILHKPLSPSQIVKILEGGDDKHEYYAKNQNSIASQTNPNGKRPLGDDSEIGSGGAASSDGTAAVGRSEKKMRSQSPVDDYETTKNIGGSRERRKNFKILLAEDNEVNRKVVSMQLKKLGFQCDCAKDGKEAVDMFKEGNYDLILMDLTMPNTDGPTASLQIRSYEEIYRSKKVIIVALTAMVLEGSKEYCKSMGMDEFLQKPLKLERLEKILTTYLLPVE